MRRKSIEERKEYNKIYQKQYRANNREKLNAHSKKCMQDKRLRERANRIQRQRKNPQPAQYVEKHYNYLNAIKNASKNRKLKNSWTEQ